MTSTKSDALAEYEAAAARWKQERAEMEKKGQLFPRVPEYLIAAIGKRDAAIFGDFKKQKEK